MKASSIITVLGGVGALALLAIMGLLRGEETEPVRSAVSESRAAPAPPGSTEGHAREGLASSPAQASSRVEGALAPTAGAARRASPSAESPSGGGVAPAQAQPGAAGVGEAGRAGEAGPEGAAGTPGNPSELEQVLEVARKAQRPDDRINALRWLGDNGTPQQFEAMQDIQIHDPSPEVRAAAELAVNVLRVRRAKDPWPGVPANSDPMEYMRQVNLPSP